MKISRVKDEIIIKIPFWQKRCNPYLLNDESQGRYPTLTGLIIRHRKDGNDYEEIGWAETLDMAYKGKPDQISDFLVMWEGEEQDFIKKCGELKIGYEIHSD